MIVLMNWYHPLKVTDMDSAIVSTATPDMMTEKLKILIGGSQDWAPASIEGEINPEEMMRLLADLVVARSLLAVGRLPQWAEILDSKGVLSAWEQESKAGVIAGCRYLSVSNCIVVDPTDAMRVDDESALVEGLNTIRECEGLNRDWIFDLSSLEEVSIHFLSYLIGFESELKKIGKRVLLLWLKQGSVPDAFLFSMKGRFSLSKKGVFLLSRPPEEEI